MFTMTCIPRQTALALFLVTWFLTTTTFHQAFPFSYTTTTTTTTTRRSPFETRSSFSTRLSLFFRDDDREKQKREREQYEYDQNYFSYSDYASDKDDKRKEEWHQAFRRELDKWNPLSTKLGKRSSENESNELKPPQLQNQQQPPQQQVSSEERRISEYEQGYHDQQAAPQMQEKAAVEEETRTEISSSEMPSPFLPAIETRRREDFQEDFDDDYNADRSYFPDDEYETEKPSIDPLDRITLLWQQKVQPPSPDGQEPSSAATNSKEFPRSPRAPPTFQNTVQPERHENLDDDNGNRNPQPAQQRSTKVTSFWDEMVHWPGEEEEEEPTGTDPRRLDQKNQNSRWPIPWIASRPPNVKQKLKLETPLPRQNPPPQKAPQLVENLWQQMNELEETLKSKVTPVFAASNKNPPTKAPVASSSDKTKKTNSSTQRGNVRSATSSTKKSTNPDKTQPPKKSGPRFTMQLPSFSFPFSPQKQNKKNENPPKLDNNEPPSTDSSPDDDLSFSIQAMDSLTNDKNPKNKPLYDAQVGPKTMKRPQQWANLMSDPMGTENENTSTTTSSKPQQWANVQQWTKKTFPTTPVSENDQLQWQHNNNPTYYPTTTTRDPATEPLAVAGPEAASSTPDKYKVILDWADREDTTPTNMEVLNLLRAQSVAAAQWAGKSRWGKEESDRAVSTTAHLLYGSEPNQEKESFQDQESAFHENQQDSDPILEPPDEPRETVSLPDRYQAIMEWAEQQQVVPTWNQILYLLRSQKVAAAARAGNSRWGAMESDHACVMADILSGNSLGSQEAQSSENERPPEMEATVSKSTAAAIDSSTKSDIAPIVPTTVLNQLRWIKVANTAKMSTSRWGTMEIIRAQQMADSIASIVSSKFGQEQLSMDQLAKQWIAMTQLESDMGSSLTIPIGGCPPFTAPKQESLPGSDESTQKDRRYSSADKTFDIQRPKPSVVSSKVPTNQPMRSSESETESTDLNTSTKPIGSTGRAAKKPTTDVKGQGVSEIARERSTISKKEKQSNESAAGVTLQSNDSHGTKRMDQLTDEWTTMNRESSSTTRQVDRGKELGEIPKGPTRPSFLETLYLGRSLRVAEASARNKSRWGRMENIRAKQMAEAFRETKRSSDVSMSRRARQLHLKTSADESAPIAATPIGKFSNLPHHKVDRRKHPSVESDTPISSSMKISELARQRGAAKRNTMPQKPKSQAYVRSRFSSEIVDETKVTSIRPPIYHIRNTAVETTTKVETSSGETRESRAIPKVNDGRVAPVEKAPEPSNRSESNAKGLPGSYHSVAAWAKSQSEPPSSVHVYYLLRNYKLSSFAEVGKSRWGSPENRRAKYETNLLLGEVSSETSTSNDNSSTDDTETVHGLEVEAVHDTAHQETSSLSVERSPASSNVPYLYHIRSIDIAAMAESGHPSRWGQMEVKKAQQMTEIIADHMGARHRSLKELAAEWAAIHMKEPLSLSSFSAPIGHSLPQQTDVSTNKPQEVTNSPLSKNMNELTAEWKSTNLDDEQIAIDHDSTIANSLTKQEEKAVASSFDNSSEEEHRRETVAEFSLESTDPMPTRGKSITELAQEFTARYKEDGSDEAKNIPSIPLPVVHTNNSTITTQSSSPAHTAEIQENVPGDTTIVPETTPRPESVHDLAQQWKNRNREEPSSGPQSLPIFQTAPQKISSAPDKDPTRPKQKSLDSATIENIAKQWASMNRGIEAGENKFSSSKSFLQPTLSLDADANAEKSKEKGEVVENKFSSSKSFWQPTFQSSWSAMKRLDADANAENSEESENAYPEPTALDAKLPIQSDRPNESFATIKTDSRKENTELSVDPVEGELVAEVQRNAPDLSERKYDRRLDAFAPEIATSEDRDSVGNLPERYETIMEWAAREPVAPTLNHVIYQLRNLNVASFASAGKSRWGRGENRRTEEIAADISEQTTK